MGVDFIEASSHPSDEISKDPYARPGHTDQYDPQTVLDFERPNSGFARTVGLYLESFGTPARVYYPACGTHMISSLFPESAITYLDPSENLVAVIRHNMPGVLAIAAKAGDFSPEEPFDLVISQNSHAPMADQVKDLLIGGHLLCNNYFGTRDAEEAAELPYLRLVGIVTVAHDDNGASRLLTPDHPDFASWLGRVDEHVFRRIA